MTQLGMGQNFLRKIGVGDDFRIDLDALETQIKTDIKENLQPVCVVGNAGTVNTGAIDPLEEMACICRKYNLWFHVDGTYGALSAGSDLVRNKFAGLDKADSVAVDFHKWLFVPFEAGCLMVKDRGHLRNVYGHIPEYQRFNSEDSDALDYSEYSFQQSRNFKALKVWFNYKVYGANKLREAIQNSIILIGYLKTLINGSVNLKLIGEGLSIVCIQYLPKNPSKKADEDYINRLNKEIVRISEEMGEVFFRDTILNKKTVLRICCTNHRREQHHIDFLFERILAYGKMAEMITSI